MPSVRIECGHVSLKSRTSKTRWYVWFRTSGGRRRQRVNAYLRRAMLDGRGEHAKNVADKVKTMGGEVDMNILTEVKDGGANSAVQIMA